MSAVGIFFLGAGVTVFHGIQGLIQPTEVLDYTITYWGVSDVDAYSLHMFGMLKCKIIVFFLTAVCLISVLGGSFVLEGISFLVALRTIAHNAAKRGMKVLDYIWLGKDPTPIAVMLEDSGAVVGILIAGKHKL